MIGFLLFFSLSSGEVIEAPKSASYVFEVKEEERKALKSEADSIIEMYKKALKEGNTNIKILGKSLAKRDLFELESHRLTPYLLEILKKIRYGKRKKYMRIQIYKTLGFIGDTTSIPLLEEIGKEGPPYIGEVESEYFYARHYAAIIKAKRKLMAEIKKRQDNLDSLICFLMDNVTKSHIISDFLLRIGKPAVPKMAERMSAMLEGKKKFSFKLRWGTYHLFPKVFEKIGDSRAVPVLERYLDRSKNGRQNLFLGAQYIEKIIEYLKGGEK